MGESYFLEFFKSIPPEAYWLFIFFSTFIENIFPPFPGDTLVAFTGYLWGAGLVTFQTLSLSIIAGNLTGALLMYFFGLEVMEFFLKHLKSERLKKLFDKEHLDRTHHWFDKYGFFAVMFSRFSAGIRFFVSIVAGMANMHVSVFILAFLLATAIWNTLLVYGGYVMGENWREILQYIQIYSAIFAIVLIIAGIYFYRRFKQKEKDTKE